MHHIINNYFGKDENFKKESFLNGTVGGMNYVSKVLILESTQNLLVQYLFPHFVELKNSFLHVEDCVIVYRNSVGPNFGLIKVSRGFLKTLRKVLR